MEISAFAEQFKTNNTLKEINLESNMIGTIGAQALATALRYNNTLVKLNISNNEGLVGEGILPILESLETNVTLKQLNISGCYDRQKKKYKQQQIQNGVGELSHIIEFVTVSYCC